MASIFKRKRTVDGRTVEAAKYTIEYTDATGERRRVPGFTDKSKTWELARKLESGAATCEHLKHRKTSLTDHLASFKQHLEAQNDTPKHIKQTETRIKAILDGCGFKLLRDVNLPDVEDWLAKQRTAKAFGIKTSNYYGRDFKAFLAWLVEANRAETNPMERFSPLNAETDDSRQRRALSANDFTKLMDATLAGASYRGINGTDRTMLYLVAAYTGLRVSELASLTPESIDLEAAVVTVQAAHSNGARTSNRFRAILLPPSGDGSLAGQVSCGRARGGERPPRCCDWI